MTRAAFGQKANAALRTALGDLNVSLKFDINGYAPEANDIIVEAMGWRTLQVPRASALTETLRTLTRITLPSGKPAKP